MRVAESQRERVRAEAVGSRFDTVLIIVVIGLIPHRASVHQLILKKSPAESDGAESAANPGGVVIVFVVGGSGVVVGAGIR